MSYLNRLKIMAIGLIVGSVVTAFSYHEQSKLDDINLRYMKEVSRRHITSMTPTGKVVEKDLGITLVTAPDAY